MLRLLPLLVLAPALCAQEPPRGETPPGEERHEIICYHPPQPVLIGGLEALQAHAVYPPVARAEGVEGRVYVRVVILPDGSIRDIEAARSPDDRLSEEAVRVVREAARFEWPDDARWDQRTARYTLPVTFRLSDG